MKVSALIAIAAAVAMILPGASDAENQPTPQPQLPVLQIVQQLEKDGYGPFNSLIMDRGNWEIEVLRDGKFVELTVDAATGEILAEYRDEMEATPASDAMPLSALLAKLTSEVKFDHLDDISLEPRYWEMEITRNGQKRELHVNPLNAQIISNRIDE